MGLLPENAPAAEVFAACGTQWRRDGWSGALLGLRYEGVEAAARVGGVALTPDDFARVRFLERELMAIDRRRRG